MSEVSNMYGREGEYFGSLPPDFRNYVWIELIGFDNTLPDFGATAFLNRLGYKPHGLLLLVTSVDFINMFAGMDKEYTLPEYYCSYGGHPCNDERDRQSWTNYQLRGLVTILHDLGVKAYLSIFDAICPGNSITEDHPELKTAAVINNEEITIPNNIYMTKRFSDGSFYEDYLLSKAVETLKGYNFDGLHLADGIVRPRLPIQFADFSDDMLEQSQIKIPSGVNKVLYITREKRREWIAFCTKRWAEFLQKIIPGVQNEGYEVITNSTWTKEPMEAIYRYGTDYKVLTRLGLSSFVVENGAPTLAMLDDGANAGYHQDYARRKFIHHEFAASLMLIKAYMKNVPLTPLYPLRDTNEQYDVIHHMPTTLQRHTASMFNSFIIDNSGSLSPVISGHTFCLGDGLSRDDWRFIRLCSDNGYTRNVMDVPGATIIWSDKRNEREVQELIVHRTWSSAKWLAELQSRGAAIHKVAHIEDLDAVHGDILVTNHHLLPGDEAAKIKEYKNGEIIYIFAPADDKDYSKELNPIGMGFPYPLYFAEVPEAVLQECVERINRGLAYISDYSEQCHVQEVKTGAKTSRFLVDNEEYYYTVPKIHTGRKIKSASAVTKSRGYKVRIEEDTFKVLVPLRGMDIVEVEFL